MEDFLPLYTSLHATHNSCTACMFLESSAMISCCVIALIYTQLANASDKSC